MMYGTNWKIITHRPRTLQKKTNTKTKSGVKKVKAIYCTYLYIRSNTTRGVKVIWNETRI